MDNIVNIIEGKSRMTTTNKTPSEGNVLTADLPSQHGLLVVAD